MRRLGGDEWKRLIAEYEAGDLTQKEFAAKHDVSVATLQFHLYKLRRGTSIRNSESSPAFVPVEVVASPASSTRARDAGLIEVGLRSGAVLRFLVGTDVRYLAELLSALG